jgi:hypothetical protein
MPTHVLPSRPMPTMPFPTNTDSDSNSRTQTWQYPVSSTEPHPHPLRSHSTENLFSFDNSASQTDIPKAARSARSHSCLVTSAHHHRRSVLTYGRHRSHDNYPTPPLPAALHPAFRATSPEGFGDSAVMSSEAGATETSVESVRPVLRPTISFGGESRMSYWSLDALEGSSLDQKSKAIAAAEKVHYQQRQAGLSSWKFYVSTAMLCMLSFLGGVNVTCLSTALSVRIRRLWLNANKLMKV